MKRPWIEICVEDYYECIGANIIQFVRPHPEAGCQYRLVDRSRDDPFTLLVAPAGWCYWWGLVVYRLCQSLRLTGNFVVVVLDIWGVADWDPVTVPVWECIRPLRWLAHKIQFRRVE